MINRPRRTLVSRRVVADKRIFLVTGPNYTVDPKSADFLNVKNRVLYAECWQNPTSFSMNPHPQLTPVYRRGADSAILGADVWQNLEVMRIFRTFGVHRDTLHSILLSILGTHYFMIDQKVSWLRLYIHAPCQCLP
ncbi:hypothetical protein AG1IA_06681 [Rhizoctonia solani AG-1 IA]|uniref:Uncharacterized protein n=1 Tax=Thanatephorus cucumeris (strain AG1-IA) TaxID=983506 RepID=L8WMY0_THACA|nr:hypothetical protein AG1IA_06681 [Rhizoctonia solani AG-1 IA]